ncbi:MAG: CoA pyrophosphatase [Bacteroidales bacterium]|jgi:8-oxo-dGTP pyrophosphatase MutT (NUDIX family)|nr:CoA pyrophosphatase [Bacteroidales bacterium]MDD4217178.1 CoA pyrophosphatase [Bacteroidales bacterium]MDY0143828.1 CoA pyrophosphatase [Bacteroidales bacterium]
MKNIKSLEELLIEKLSKKLPGMSAQKKMIPAFPDNEPEYFNYDQILRDAAVLICLFEDNNRIKTVLIERVEDSGPHSGQIAFPGGKKENTDNDLIDTAIREANEEVGLKTPKESYVGSLTSVQIPISRYNVLPVICIVENIGELFICQNEVRNVFVADLFDLLESESIRQVCARQITIDAPSYAFGKHIVWGATAMVLKELKEIIG